MNDKAKIIEAQCSKISSLADFENMVGDLYEVYATRFPAMQTFWTSIVKEERKHAKLLLSMIKLVQDGHFFYNLDTMDTKMIEGYVASVRKGLTAASQDSIKPLDAIATALSIEASVVEADFYKDVKSDAPEFAIIAKHLISDTQHHADLIAAELKKLRHADA